MHPSKVVTTRIFSVLCCVFALWLTGCKLSEAKGDAAEEERKAAPLPALPMHYPDLAGKYGAPGKDGPPLETTTLVPEIQQHLETYIHDHGNPIAAIVVVDVKTGGILAMAQGRDPKEWGGNSNTATHTGFPTASLFKTIVAAAGFEIAEIDPQAPIGLAGSCADVHPQGSWLRQGGYGRVSQMNLHRAYGNSCNGFFAKIAVNQIGLGSIATYARRFGWDGQAIPSDFQVPISPIKFPNPTTSSVHTVGRFAAGFGYVGTSPVHIAWQMLAIANQGRGRPIRIFKDSEERMANFPAQQIISPHTADSIRGLMDATVLGGTASHAFRYGRYRRIRPYAGGKTGTLNGYAPKGLTTWFAGMLPLEDPQVVVASVVVLEDLWRFKASSLAAEAMLEYADYAKILGQNVSAVGKKRSRL